MYTPQSPELQAAIEYLIQSIQETANQEFQELSTEQVQAIAARLVSMRADVFDATDLADYSDPTSTPTP